tara:strand:- start:14 stop:1579 length:1566 start_codon:yes stop_codon:yes gene_type:complete
VKIRSGASANAKRNVLPLDTFIRLLTIYKKKSQRLDFFDPFEVQADLLDKLQKYDKIIIVKARQMGISTMVRAWMFYQSYYDDEPKSYGCVAHTRDASYNVSKMDRVFNDNLPRGMKRTLLKNSQGEMIFKDTQASLKSFTAGAKTGTRSFQLDAAHLSEFAFYDNQEEFLSTIMATVGGNQIIIESTPNILGDKFSDLVFDNINERAQYGHSEWLVLFYPWYQHPDYKQKCPPTFQLREGEKDFMMEYDLTIEQMYWRRKQITTLGKQKFMREYPSSIEEAFRSSGRPYFCHTSLERIEVTPNSVSKYKRYENVDPRGAYIIGVDPSTGVGLDYSAISVIDINSRQVVAQYWCNETEPIKFTETLVDIAWEWNEAKVIVECNSVGQVILWKLKDLGYRKLWKCPKGKHFVTTKKTRPLLFETLRDIISDNLLFKLNKMVITQLSNIYYDNDRPCHPVGGHDDIVVSMCLAYYAIKDIPLDLETYVHTDIFNDWKKKKRSAMAARALPWNINGSTKGRGTY